MCIRILGGEEGQGSVSFELEVEADYVKTQTAAASRCCEIEMGFAERSSSPAKSKYITGFIASKAVNDIALSLGIEMAATPQIMPVELFGEGSNWRFSARVYPCPDAMLANYDPVDLRSWFIAAPGCSLSEEDASSGYLSDGDRITLDLVGRLTVDIRKDLLDRVVQEEGTAFSLSLKKTGSSIEKYCSQMNINERNFSAYMTAEAFKLLQRRFALDAYFVGAGLDLAEEDVWEAIGILHPGKDRQQMREVYELHGDMPKVRAEARRRVALRQLMESAVR